MGGIRSGTGQYMVQYGVVRTRCGAVAVQAVRGTGQYKRYGAVRDDTGGTRAVRVVWHGTGRSTDWYGPGGAGLRWCTLAAGGSNSVPKLEPHVAACRLTCRNEPGLQWSASCKELLAI